MTGVDTWTRDVLTELRQGRFRLSAWVRFIGRSYARADERRAERRAEHRAVVALGAAGAGAWSLAAAAGRPWLALAGASWWLLQAAMLDWHLGMLERPDGSRLHRLGRANLLTIARGGLPPALFVLAGSSAGLVLLLLAGALDVADGRLARRRSEETVLGVWLDGSADTFVVGAAALGAVAHSLLPGWAASLVLLRLALPWGLAAGAYFGRIERPPLHALSGSRPASLAAGAIVFAGLASAFLQLSGAGAVAAGGAVAGLGPFVVAVRRTLTAAS